MKPNTQQPWHLRYGELARRAALEGMESLSQEEQAWMEEASRRLAVIGPAALEEALGTALQESLQAAESEGKVIPFPETRCDFTGSEEAFRRMKLAAQSEALRGDLYNALKAANAGSFQVGQLVELPESSQHLSPRLILIVEGSQAKLKVPSGLFVRFQGKIMAEYAAGEEAVIYLEELRSAKVSFVENSFDGPTLIIDN